MSTWIETSLHEAVQALTRSGDCEIAACLGRLLDEPELKALQLYRSPKIGTLADELFDCDTLETLYELLATACAAFKVSHCTIHCVRERSAAFFRTKVLTTYPEEWVTEYVGRRYSTVDPVIARCLAGPGTFFWDELKIAAPTLRGFIASATRHGVGPSGVTFVQDNERGNTIAISLASTSEPEEFRRSFRPKLSDFSDIANLMLEVFSDLACEAVQAEFNPTDDQLKVLRALASGKSLAEIENFHFSYGSFVTIEKSILKSFGAKTLAQAAALAAMKGLLESLPYSGEDIYPPRK